MVTENKNGRSIQVKSFPLLAIRMIASVSLASPASAGPSGSVNGAGTGYWRTNGNRILDANN